MDREIKYGEERNWVCPLELWPVKQMDVCWPANGLVPSVQKKKKKRKSLRRATPAGSFLFFSSLLEGMRKQLVAGLLLLKTHLFCGCVCMDPDMVDTGWGRVGAFPVWLLLVLRTISEENLRAFPSVFSPPPLPRTYGLTALLHSHPLLFTDRFFPSEDARAS